MGLTGLLLIATPKSLAQNPNASSSGRTNPENDGTEDGRDQKSTGSVDNEESLVVLIQQQTDLGEHIKELESDQKALDKLQDDVKEQQQQASRANPDPSKLSSAIKRANADELSTAMSDFVQSLRSLQFFYNSGFEPDSGTIAEKLRKQIAHDVSDAWGDLNGVFIRVSNRVVFSPDSKSVTRDAQELVKSFTPEKIATLKRQVADKLQEGSTAVETQRGKMVPSLKAASLERAKVQAAINRVGRPTQITETSIRWGLPFYFLSVVFLVALPIIVHYRYAQKNDNNSSLIELLRSGILVETSTVLLLTITILILGLAEKVNGSVLGTLIGGISGYVLNRAQQVSRDRAQATTATKNDNNNKGGAQIQGP